VNLPLFRRTLSANRNLLLATGLGMIVWGAVLPVIYGAFGREIGAFAQGNPLFEQFSRFGGGDLFSLPGTIALGFVHPFTLLIMGIVAIGYPAQAIAGERAKGTLEIVLARPISRIRLYTSLFVGWLLFVGFMALTFTASSMSDRIGPAIGIPLAFVLVNYLANAIGSLWPDMVWLQDYSMFTLVKAKTVLESGIAASDVAILVVFIGIFVALTLYLFPRRDIAAPT
jgi:ABC-type transport system involved in multi-copper enzyme maturation permease subunit